ncbi:MAG: NAD(P)-dependent oxidoreductase [Chloroflexi bacterium]|nr:NAD(P)-dependent oxidoreductase [Chloroflexota bacterium]
MKKKTVFITGTTGSMGGAGFQELLRRRERYDIVTLVRPSKANKKLMAPYLNQPGVKVVWGDLTNYEDVLKCVTGADYVLHPAAFIAPEADHHPDLAWKINAGSAENIVRAIHAQPNPNAIKLVSIGSVAMTGDRLGAIHLGRVGDPLKPSVYDAYATSKIAAEKTVVESGLKYWVSCRQTYIAIPDTLSLMDPIMFHQPIDTHIEFVTPTDAGRLLANACEDNVPEEFWRRIYNIGGGPECRVIYIEYLERVFKMLGLGDYRKLMDRDWFALRNFHCQWFEDSHVLNDYLHFREDTLESHLQQIKEHAAWYVKLAGLPGVRHIIPKPLVKKFVIEPLTKGKDGTMYWINNDLEGRITSFYGSKEKWSQIPDWNACMPDCRVKPIRLSHGYDETKPKSELALKDMQEAAKFRGGECLSPNMIKGDLTTKLKWRCAFGHEFEASPTLVLLGGHWCPECTPPPWNYDEIAKRNPFFAQVWYPNHEKAECNFYDARCFEDIL